VPAHDELILVTRTELVGDARPRKVLDALALATRYLVNHSKESWGLFVRGRPELGDEPNRRAWLDTLSRFALRPAARDRARRGRFAAFLAEQGSIPKALPVDAYAVESR